MRSNQVVSSLVRHYGVASLREGWQTGTIQRSGETPHWSFEFHGKGCRASCANAWIDFDFLPGGEVGAFDPWRIHSYLEENRSEAAPELEEVKRLFALLEDDGTIERTRDGWSFVLAQR